ncbi:MAG: diguanylate cyclase [Syntrophales bacterium]|nr:diguanylate cyclase [Syntrophales bacterium]
MKDPKQREKSLMEKLSELRERVKELEKSEAELRNSHEMLRMVIDAIPLCIFWKDKDLNYIGCNHSFAVDTGLRSPAEVIGKTDYDLTWVEQAERNHKVEMEILKTHQHRTDCKEPQKSPNGHTRYLRINKIPLRDSVGQIVGIAGTWEETAELESSDQEKLPMESHFRQLMEASPVPMLISDDEQAIFINRKFEELFGLPQKEIPILDIFWPSPSPEDKQANVMRRNWQNHIKSAMSKREEIEPMEVTVACRDGSTRHIECRLASINDRNLVVCNDMTDLRRTQEELAHVNEKLKIWICELEIHNQRMNLLQQMGNALRTCNVYEDAYNIMTQYGPQLFPKTSGCFYDLFEGSKALRPIVKWGKYSQTEILLTPKECIALRSGKVQANGPSEIGCPCVKDVMGTDRGYLCVPMIISGELQGMLRLIFHEKNEDDSGFEELALVVAEHVILSLTNLKLNESLRIQAIRDPLTGLFNRRYMEESLEREFYRSSRNHRPVSIMMLDIDHFKHFNDSYGHDAGDSLLKGLAKIMQRHVRKEDIACRFGGEEFIIILPDTSLEVARTRADHFRNELSQTPFEHKCRDLGAVTVSLGVAAFPNHGRSADDVLRMADKALYKAKENGRNRVEVV